MPKIQQKAIVGSTEHWDIIKQLEQDVKDCPKLGRTGDLSKEQTTVYFRYFIGQTEKFITELDPKTGEVFGYTILNGDAQMSELGYDALDNFKDVRSGLASMELDFYWEKKSLAQALYDYDKDYFPQPKNRKNPLAPLKALYNNLSESEMSWGKGIANGGGLRPLSSVGIAHDALINAYALFYRMVNTTNGKRIHVKDFIQRQLHDIGIIQPSAAYKKTHQAKDLYTDKDWKQINLVLQHIILDVQRLYTQEHRLEGYEDQPLLIKKGTYEYEFTPLAIAEFKNDLYGTKA